MHEMLYFNHSEKSEQSLNVGRAEVFCSSFTKHLLPTLLTCGDSSLSRKEFKHLFFGSLLMRLLWSHSIKNGSHCQVSWVTKQAVKVPF